MLETLPAGLGCYCMKQFIIAFLIFLIWSFFGLWLYSSLSSSENGEAIAVSNTSDKAADTIAKQVVRDTLGLKDSLAVSEVEKEITPPLKEGFKAVTENGDLVFFYDEGALIKKNTADLEIPEASIDFKYKLNTYLLEHPDQELHILSYYDPSENVESPNYGVQRGTKMMNLLAKTGIIRDRMVVKPTIKKMDFDSLGIYTNGIGFIFRPLDEERLKTPRISIPPPKSIYPKFVNQNIYANQELKDVVSEIQMVLESYPNVNVEIIGHTDNIGNAQDNYLVGLKYAQQARWYIINKGKIDKSRIKARSKGEIEPIADNKYKKGRIENKRIEIKYIVN